MRIFLISILLTFVCVVSSCQKQYDHFQCDMYQEEKNILDSLYLNRVISKYDYDERVENLQQTVNSYNYELSTNDDFECKL